MLREPLREPVQRKRNAGLAGVLELGVGDHDQRMQFGASDGARRTAHALDLGFADRAFVAQRGEHLVEVEAAVRREAERALRGGLRRGGARWIRGAHVGSAQPGLAQERARMPRPGAFASRVGAVANLRLSMPAWQTIGESSLATRSLYYP